MLPSILILLLAPIVVVAFLAALRPNSFRVERRTRITASPEKVFALLDDFHRWAEWSPWEKLDPEMTRSHSGAVRGVGSVYAWEGNKKVGKGRMEMIELVPPSKVVVKLDFLAPFEAHNTAEFTLVPSGAATDVTWAMHGPHPFMMKVMSIFMPMDKMVGRDFEVGLANMKTVAER
jgi:uncharacterized protein YndB with AHSA1/START domain